MTTGGGTGGDGGGMLAALHAAASKGKVEQARALLQANPLLATTRDAQGWTPGLWAAYYDQPEVLELCLAKGAPVNDVDADTYRASALHWAAGHGRVGLVLALVTQHGADPNLKDAEGQTPLHRACRSEHPMAVLALLLVGADPGVETSDGERPLQATGSTLARGFLRMAERACWRQQQQQQQQWGAISPGGWRSGLAFAPAEEEAPAVAMGAVYGRGYQSGRVVGKEKEKERGASPSTRSTGSTVDEDEEEAVVGPSDVEEEEEGEERMLVGEENDAEESEGEEGTLLLLKPGRRRARSTGRYRIVV